jgi:hypothetical protein
MKVSRPRSTFEFVDADGNSVPAARHVNPDGTPGGWVASTAKVARGSYIEGGALVAPRAIVPSQRRVRKGDLVPEPK